MRTGVDFLVGTSASRKVRNSILEMPGAHTSLHHQSFSPVNRLVQFLDSLSKIRPLQRQRYFLGKLPVLADSLDQLAQSILSVPESDAHAVLNHSVFKVNRLPGWWRQINSGYVFDHPPDLLKILPGTFA
jgi:hypothetical protein